MSGYTYDTGVLIAAERNDRLIWALHRRLLERGVRPTVPAAVLAQAWRGGPQPQISRLLLGCVVDPLSVKLPRDKSLSAQYDGAFQQTIAQIRDLMQRDPAPITVAAIQ